MPIHVNADNFVQAETHRMFRDIQAQAGGVGTFRHNRTPARIDEQTVIRLNRDTLYSFLIVDLAEPARLTLPDADDRYLSVRYRARLHFEVPAIIAIPMAQPERDHAVCREIGRAHV